MAEMEDQLARCREGCSAAAREIVAQAGVIHECQLALEHAQHNVRSITGGDERRIAKALEAIAALKMKECK